jgi:ribosomal protein S18 acetylase RimI-like enzyme
VQQIVAPGFLFAKPIDMETPKIIKLNSENIDSEHICCAFSDKKCAEGYQAKKQWLKQQFNNGYTFRKLDVRGKVFIEYVPAEYAWVPVDAPGYMHIGCFWVSGQFKGKGYGKELLAAAENDARQMNGLTAIVSAKKQPFMSDKKFLVKQGFIVCDTAPPYFELLYKPFKPDAPAPTIKPVAKNATCDIQDGIAVYYTHGCPFTDYYTKELEEIAYRKGYNFHSILIDSHEKAQNHFVPHTLYSVFHNGKFVTQHILNENYFEKFIS